MDTETRLLIRMHKLYGNYKNETVFSIKQDYWNQYTVVRDHYISIKSRPKPPPSCIRCGREFVSASTLVRFCRLCRQRVEQISRGIDDDDGRINGGHDV